MAAALCAPNRRDAAAGSLHSGHSSAWPPRSPRLMGIHAGSSPSPWHPGCRQELPALFPAFAAKRLPARRECPVLASAGTSPAPTALEGLRNGAGAAFAPPPPSPGATRRGRCSSGMGLGVVLSAPHPAVGDGHPSVQEHSLAQPEQVGWERGGICTPLLAVAPVASWGGEPGLGLPAGTQPRGTDPTDGGSPVCTGMAAPYPPLGLPVKAGGGLPCRAGAPLPRSLVLPGQELLGTALSPGTAAQGHLEVQEDPTCRGPPPSWGHCQGDAVTFSTWQCRSRVGGY